MAFTASAAKIDRTLARPFSSPNPYHHQILPTHQNDNTRGVHLISSDLWEAMTGERLTPSNICQILDSSISITGSPNSQYIQAMQYVIMSKDRQRSRIIQKKLEESRDAERDAIFNSLYPNLNDLIYDPSANFVIQKMCENLTEQQQSMMLKFFFKDVKTVTNHPNGCRVLQKFIEFTHQENVDSIFQALQNSLIPLCFSQNGNHIVQRFIELLPERVPSIIDIVLPQLSKLVIDNFGCRVVQRLFEQYPIENLEPLVQKVLSYATELATDQYGNYVVQNILGAGKQEHISILIERFKGHFPQFSLHKFASNVIEKCIKGATKEEQKQIFSEIIGNEDKYEKSRIMQMVGDQFGNYVIQRIIENGNESQQNAIYEVIYYNYDSLYMNNYAKHVISKLEELEYSFE